MINIIWVYEKNVLLEKNMMNLLMNLCKLLLDGKREFFIDLLNLVFFRYGRQCLIQFEDFAVRITKKTAMKFD
jgi:hypothetical protein